MARRFMNGLNQIISSRGDHAGLKTVVGTLGFQYLDLEATVPRIIVSQDAIVDWLQVELRAFMATRFLSELNQIISSVGDPAGLKTSRRHSLKTWTSRRRYPATQLSGVPSWTGCRAS